MRNAEFEEAATCLQRSPYGHSLHTCTMQAYKCLDIVSIQESHLSSASMANLPAQSTTMTHLKETEDELSGLARVLLK